MSKVKTTTKQPLSATLARWLLAGLLALILIGTAGGFYGVYSFLGHTAEQTAKAKSDADSSRKRVQNLELLSNELKKEQATVKKAELIVAQSKSYQYQNQIIHDLSLYAHRAGIAIGSFVFKEASTSGSSSTSTTTSSSTSTSSSGTSGSTGSASSPSNGPNSSTTTPATKAPKTVQVSIQLNGDVPYHHLLHFLHLIEQNITRMQVANVSLSRGKDSGSVAAQSLDLEVYVR